MSNPIRPTVGRVVYFMPGIGCNLAVSKAGVLAALITAVHTDDCINLAVFDANGEHHALSSVNHESIAAQYVDGRHSCWDWMPYQKEQAAKIEQLEMLEKQFVGGSSLFLPHQQRVVNERLELADKITKLTAFTRSSAFAILILEEQERLLRQYSYMTMYSKVLGERIAAFQEPKVPSPAFADDSLPFCPHNTVNS